MRERRYNIMRTPKIKQSILRNPINELMASEASVRLLRVFIDETEGPISAADAAGRAELSLPGTTAALRRLMKTGFVVRVGGGRSAQYTVAKDTYLMPVLSELFHAEQLRYNAIITAMREACSGLHEVRSAWIERMPTESSEPLEIHAIVEIDSVSWVKRELRVRVESVEREFDLLIELVFHTDADMQVAEISPPEVLLAGVPPQRAIVSSPKVRSHSDMDTRSLRMSAGLAHLVEQDPSLVRAAKDHIDRLLHEGQGMADADLMEWRRILETYSNEKLRHLMTSDSSRAERLRQSSPFFAVLSARERDELMVYLKENE